MTATRSASAGNDREIVCDQQHRESALAPFAVQQLQDLDLES